MMRDPSTYRAVRKNLARREHKPFVPQYSDATQFYHRPYLSMGRQYSPNGERERKRRLRQLAR